jgi:hypothetical protein
VADSIYWVSFLNYYQIIKKNFTSCQGAFNIISSPINKHYKLTINIIRHLKFIMWTFYTLANYRVIWEACEKPRCWITTYVLIQCIWVGSRRWEFAFPTYSQVTLMLLAQVTHFENHCSSNVLCTSSLLPHSSHSLFNTS